ncbi:hypothetical protein [Trinickia symbiotica]|uniref:hypothetical protein n=1 Tax=Trinickia symbiotica TaxID=863227 RepID=UPI0015E78BB4|nr:hypothetical protein [Trinickia symbiotica]
MDTDGVSIAGILAKHPECARRTVQRWLNQLVAAGRLQAVGAGRARRYVASGSRPAVTAHAPDAFAHHLPLMPEYRKRDLAEPDPLRLAWREVIKAAVREAVRQPESEPLDVVRKCVSKHELGADREKVEALAIEELRRLHEGVLARYGLRPSDLAQWQTRQAQM